MIGILHRSVGDLIMDTVIYVKETPDKGRGVFALATFLKGEIIEVAPYIAVPAKEHNIIEQTSLNNYWYLVNGKKDCAIGLGYTSLYNHSNNPNATYFIRSKSKTIKIVASVDILANQEITIDYGYDPAEIETNHANQI